MSELPKKAEDTDAKSTSEWDSLAGEVQAVDRLRERSLDEAGQPIEELVDDIAQSQETTVPTGEQPLMQEAPKDGGTVYQQERASSEPVYQEGSAPDEGAPVGSRENPKVVDYPGGTMNTANKAASTKIGGPEQS